MIRLATCLLTLLGPANEPQPKDPAPAVAAEAPTVDLRAKWVKGETFRYRYTIKQREYGPDKKAVDSTCEVVAVLEGLVKETGPGGTTLELQYKQISVHVHTATVDWKADPDTPPQTPAEKASRHVIDKLLSKRMNLIIDAEGHPTDLTGLPKEVFAGMREYQDEDDIKAARDTLGPAYPLLTVQLGDVYDVSWMQGMVCPGRAPPKASVGQQWRDENCELELTEIKDGRAYILAVPKAIDQYGPKGDPLRTPPRYVWDGKAGYLVEAVSSFDSLNMKGTDTRQILSESLTREIPKDAAPKPEHP